jgi:3-phenylpropionate/trans-cinnamate dioxygenase ferredoxin subunit
LKCREEKVMARFVRVGTRADFEASGTGRLVEVEGRRIALFSVGGGYYAIDDVCPHKGGPLSEGPLSGDEVTCPWHGSRFNVKTGAVTGPPAQQGVKSFPVRVTGEDVEVGID